MSTGPVDVPRKRESPDGAERLTESAYSGLLPDRYLDRDHDDVDIELSGLE